LAERLVVLGQVAGAHGIRGQLRVRHFGDAAAHLAGCPWVELFDEEDPDSGRRHEVSFSGSGRPGEVRLGLVGIADRDEAAALRGLLVRAPASLLPELEAGEYYWYELVGCEVFGERAGRIGRVRELLATGGHDVLVVETDDGREHLIPTADAILLAVDLAARRIEIDDLPGLIDPGAGAP
jgi:16S rRNA processing protein RimM